MSAQDKINLANELLAISARDLTADEIAQVQQGVRLNRLLVDLEDFKNLLDTYPDDALEIVADFKASPQFTVLESLMQGANP